MQQPPNQEYPQTYVLDNIPFEEQRIIDELVELWQTRYEPRDLHTHLRGTLKPGGYSVAWFFEEVRQDLLTDKHSKYAASSTFEFKQFLETEYCRLYQASTERHVEAQAKAEAERQAQVKAEAERQAQIKEEAERQAQEREERVKRARADFDALGKEMAKATTRAVLVELGRRREDLAPYTGIRHPYENVCWGCYSRISSTIHVRCKVCGWYICNRCGSCKKPVCDRTYTLVQDKAVSPFLPDYPDDLS